jgi:hypothetical protein
MKKNEVWHRLFGALASVSECRQTLVAAGVADKDIVARLLESSAETTAGLKSITEEFMRTLRIEMPPALADDTASGDFVPVRPPLIYDTIQRLFREQPSPLGDDQAPSLECAVMFHGGFSIQGVLSETPDGGLRMLSPSPNPNDARPQRGKVIMTESFFDYSDIVSVGVRREIEVTLPRNAS